MDYYAEYASNMAGKTGCVYMFIIGAETQLDFPPNITALCNLCNERHSFRKTTTHLTPGPSSKKAILKWASDNNIEVKKSL